jgi:L-ascorbate peroxidase
LTLQAVLHDAGTYDPSAKTGGLNGSLRYELNRVENKQLGAVIKQVEAAKAKIDASPLSTAPISFSDTLALAGLVGFAQVVWRVCDPGADVWSLATASQAQSAAVFKDNLCGRGKDGACEQLYQAYGNKPPNCRLGRLDSSSADAEGLIPTPGASASEYKVRDAHALPA